MRKTITSLTTLGLLALSLSFTSCDFMVGMAAGAAYGLANTAYYYGNSGYNPYYGSNAYTSSYNNSSSFDVNEWNQFAASYNNSDMSSENGGYAAPQQGGYNGGNSGGNNGVNSGTNTSTSAKTHKCGLCNGTGRTIKTNGASFGKTKYCSECGKTVPDYHYHSACESCKGKGYW